MVNSEESIRSEAVRDGFPACQAGMSGERQAESEYDFEKTKPICAGHLWA
jgi:hypothetical protein